MRTVVHCHIDPSGNPSDTLPQTPITPHLPEDPIMAEAYIYDAVRTPRGKGKADGALHEVTALHLATTVLQAVRDRNELDTALVDDVVLGVVSPINEQGSVIARTAVLNADYAETTAGVQINRFCASGLEAVNMAAAQVMSGSSEFAIGGGVESMSRVPMGSDGGAWSTDPSIAIKSYFTPQGIGADMIATKWGFSRTDVDAFAVESQRRAAEAWKAGRFKKSVVPVKDIIGQTLLDHDEHMRPETTMQSLGALRASFEKLGEDAGFDNVLIQRYPEVERINHVHHAGNSSGIVDGAAAVLIGTKEAGQKAGLKPRARIRGFTSIGSEPGIMLTGPEKVTRKLLARVGMKPDDIDLYELNEAFASVVMLYMKLLQIPHDKINVNGGAIAMGHPLGATGAMILGTLLDEMERRDVGTGLATLCVGGGMGTATIIERL
jgi:acetyl-CoA C-acetyltransferase